MEIPPIGSLVLDSCKRSWRSSAGTAPHGRPSHTATALRPQICAPLTCQKFMEEEEEEERAEIQSMLSVTLAVVHGLHDVSQKVANSLIKKSNKYRHDSSTILASSPLLSMKQFRTALPSTKFFSACGYLFT